MIHCTACGRYFYQHLKGNTICTVCLMPTDTRAYALQVNLSYCTECHGVVNEYSGAGREITCLQHQG